MRKFYAPHIAPEKNCQPETEQAPMSGAGDETGGRLPQMARAGESLKTT